MRVRARLTRGKGGLRSARRADALRERKLGEKAALAPAAADALVILVPAAAKHAAREAGETRREHTQKKTSPWGGGIRMGWCHGVRASGSLAALSQP